MQRYTIEIAGTAYTIDVQELGADRFRVLVGGESFDVRLAQDADLPAATTAREIVGNGAPAPAVRPAAQVLPATPRPAAAPLSMNGHRGGELVAPLPGTILSIAVAPGARIERGQELLVLEAMKMKNTIRAPQAGVVAEVLVHDGQTVRHGDLLLRIQPD
jgi:biotin carboxyl carrier protein